MEYVIPVPEPQKSSRKQLEAPGPRKLAKQPKVAMMKQLKVPVVKVPKTPKPTGQQKRQSKQPPPPKVMTPAALAFTSPVVASNSNANSSAQLPPQQLMHPNSYGTKQPILADGNEMLDFIGAAAGKFLDFHERVNR